MVGTLPAMSTQPGVGRIVHYVARGSADGVFPPACRAAVVTEVVHNIAPTRDDTGSITGATWDGSRIGLAVLNPTGLFFDPDIEYDEGRMVPSERADGLGAGPRTELCDGQEHRGGTWHWPART